MIKELINRALAMSPFDMCVFIMLFAVTLGWIIAGVYSFVCWIIGIEYHVDHMLAMVLSVWALVFKCKCVLNAKEYSSSLIGDYNGTMDNSI